MLPRSPRFEGSAPKEFPLKQLYGIVLVFIGAALILAPLIRYGIASERDKERILRYYEQNSSASMVPIYLKPSGFEGYDWCCFGIGTSIAFTGVSMIKLGGRSGGMEKPSPTREL